MQLVAHRSLMNATQQRTSRFITTAGVIQHKPLVTYNIGRGNTSRVSSLNSVQSNSTSLFSSNYTTTSTTSTNPSDWTTNKYEYILCEKHDKVALVTLNRPKALNALCNALMNDLNHALLLIDQDNTIGSIVITGSERAFAAGADIKGMSYVIIE